MTPRGRPTEPSQATGGERGSVAMAALLVVFAAMLGAIAVGRGIAVLDQAASDGDRSSAGAGAELAVAEAIARIDAGATAPFADKLSIPSAEVRWEATRIDLDTWEVYGQGTSDGATEARQVTVTRQGAASPGFALFATGRIDLSRGGPNTVTGRLGSNGSVTIGSTTVTEDVVVHGPSGTCTDCKATTLADALDVPYPTPPTGSSSGGPTTDSDKVSVDDSDGTCNGCTTTVTPTTTVATRSCSSVMWFYGTVDGGNGEPFVCDTSSWVLFYGTVEVINPPLIVYLGPSTRHLVYNANVNAGGSPADVQVLAEKPTSSLWYDSMVYLYASSFNGMLYAPGRYAYLYSKFRGNGLFVLGDVISNSWSAASFTYDPAVAPIDPLASAGGTGGTWQVTGWEKITPRP